MNHDPSSTYNIIVKTTVKPHLKSLDNTVHSRNHVFKPCKKGEFQCKSDGVCIVDYKVCNSYKDCSDESDEEGCVANYDEDYGNAQFILSIFIMKSFYFIIWLKTNFKRVKNKFKYLYRNR